MRIIWLSVKCLFQCAANSSSIRLQYDHCNCSQALLLLLHTPDVGLRLISRALLSCLSSASESDDTSQCVLKDDELSKLVDMLSSEIPKSFSSFDIPLPEFLKMIKQLLKNVANASLFQQQGIRTLLAALSDRVTGEEEQKILAEMMRKLAQFESEGDLVDAVDATESNYDDLGMRICI